MKDEPQVAMVAGSNQVRSCRRPLSRVGVAGKGSQWSGRMTAAAGSSWQRRAVVDAHRRQRPVTTARWPRRRVTASRPRFFASKRQPPAPQHRRLNDRIAKQTAEPPEDLPAPTATSRTRLALGHAR